jgi:hypothetical protein
MMKRYFILIPLALLAMGFSQPMTSGPVVDSVRAIFATYSDGNSENDGVSWQRPVFTKRFTAIIRKWEAKHTNDEVPPYGDGDWFCNCQDYDVKKAKLSEVTVIKTGPGRYTASSFLYIGWDYSRRIDLRIAYENGQFLIDDIYEEDENAMLSTLLLK